MFKGNVPRYLKKMEEEYVATLDSFERVALAVARKHFGEAFDLERTIGFRRFLDTKSRGPLR